MPGPASDHSASPPPGDPTDIVVVDDSADGRDLLCTVLELEGYRTLAVAGGAEVLDLLTRIALPALILLDFMMPEMDGLQVFAALQADDAFATIPVVFVTASPENVVPTLRRLQKPVSHHELIRVAREFCAPTPPPMILG